MAESINKCFEQMIIIEASHINFGGSFNLLKDLTNYLNEKQVETIVYLSYPKVYEQVILLNHAHIQYIKTSTISTIFRYLRRRENVLFFCSLPPFVHNKKSYVYFHSDYYANKLNDGYSGLSFKEKIKKIVYYFWIKLFKNKCSNFLCQTERVKTKLLDAYEIDACICPFYNSNFIHNTILDQPRIYDFIYPALGSKHKNHLKLLDAVLLLRKEIKFSLILTISDDIKDVIEKIEEINKFYPKTIINVGVVDQKNIFSLLTQTRFMIFPSKMESLGLPLIEGVSCGLKVLVSDLNYAHQAIYNPICFEPNDIYSIANCMQKALDGEFNELVQKIKLKDNKEYLLSLLKDDN